MIVSVCSFFLLVLEQDQKGNIYGNTSCYNICGIRWRKRPNTHNDAHASAHFEWNTTLNSVTQNEHIKTCITKECKSLSEIAQFQKEWTRRRWRKLYSILETLITISGWLLLLMAQLFGAAEQWRALSSSHINVCVEIILVLSLARLLVKKISNLWHLTAVQLNSFLKMDIGLRTLCSFQCWFF